MYHPDFANKDYYFLLNMILYHLKEKKVRLTRYKHRCSVSFVIEWFGEVDPFY